MSYLYTVVNFDKHTLKELDEKPYFSDSIKHKADPGELFTKTMI